MNHDLTGKKVLLIGSGEDLNGRGLRERIDAEACEWDAIARVNKCYGNTEDVGQRTDIAFVFRRSWFNLFLIGSQVFTAVHIVAFREGVGCGVENCGKNYRAAVAAKIGMERVSTGLAAVFWLLERGATVEIIGFGTGENPAKKVYADGTLDLTPRFDWAAERAWIEAQEGVRFL